MNGLLPKWSLRLEAFSDLQIISTHLTISMHRTQSLYRLSLGEYASKKNKAIVWDGECEEAFRKLKEICTSIPILAYADFSKRFKLHTDACTLGLGAIYIKTRIGLIAP